MRVGQPSERALVRFGATPGRSCSRTGAFADVPGAERWVFAQLPSARLCSRSSSAIAPSTSSRSNSTTRCTKLRVTSRAKTMTDSRSHPLPKSSRIVPATYREDLVVEAWSPGIEPIERGPPWVVPRAVLPNELQRDFIGNEVIGQPPLFRYRHARASNVGSGLLLSAKDTTSPDPARPCPRIGTHPTQEIGRAHV